MNDEQRRIKSYLTTQGAKLSPGEIIDKVRAAMADLNAAAATVPPDRFHERPAPEEWSGDDVMAHVVSSGRSFGDRIVQILDGLPVVTPATHDREVAPPRHTPEEWAVVLGNDRAVLFDRVQRADPGTRLDATIEHPFFGPLNWRESLLFLRLHDLDHAGQLQKIGAALGAHPSS